MISFHPSQNPLHCHALVPFFELGGGKFGPLLCSLVCAVQKATNLWSVLFHLDGSIPEERPGHWVFCHSENSRRLWLFPGSVRGFLRTKLRESPGKSSKSPHATNSGISGTGKGKPAGNLGSTLPGHCPHLPCRVFLGINSSSLLEFCLIDGH